MWILMNEYTYNIITHNMSNEWTDNEWMNINSSMNEWGGICYNWSSSCVSIGVIVFEGEDVQ